MVKPLLTMKQLQETLQVSRQVVYTLRREGMPYKKVGNAVRFDYDEVMKWIDERTKEENK